MSGEETFHHEVDPWTVGDLRRSLEGIPDDWPMKVWVAEEPGGQFVTDQVIVSAASGADFFDIGCEFPTGEYYRRR